jgi:hypothetical protein
MPEREFLARLTSGSVPMLAKGLDLCRSPAAKYPDVIQRHHPQLPGCDASASFPVDSAVHTPRCRKGICCAGPSYLAAAAARADGGDRRQAAESAMRRWAVTDAFQLPVSWRLCFLAVVVGAILAGHGLVHLMGVALLWEAGRTWRPALRRRCPDGPGRCLGTCSGRCGCCPAALFVLAGARLIGQRGRWAMVAVCSVAVSRQ